MAHDGYVKHWLSHPDTARDLQIALPPALRALIDWTSLQSAPTVTVDEKGIELRSDIVLALRTVDQDPLWLHLHVEHQRTVERRMPLRVLAYQSRIWQAWDGEGVLPAVVSVVLYNGARPWTAATQVQDLVAPSLVARLGDQLTRGGFLLVDVAELAEAPTLGPGFRLGLRLLQAADEADLWSRVASWGALLHAVALLPDGAARVVAALTYVGRLVGAPSPDAWQAVRAHLPRAIQEDMMTWEQTIETRSRVQTLRETLRVQLTARFGSLPEDAKKRIEQAEPSQLDAWILRFGQGLDALDDLWTS